jgi:hypothetical protein
MHEQLFKEGQVFIYEGVKYKILSVGNHQVADEPAGFSYSFRPLDDIEKDEAIAKKAEEKLDKTES